MDFIFLDFLLLLLQLHCATGNEELDIEEIIQDVGERDNHFSTDIHKFIPKDAEYLLNLTFSDWNMQLTQHFGQGYRGPVISNEKATLRAILRGINSTHILLNSANVKTGRVCDVTLTGPQLLRNYVRYYRRQKENSKKDHGLLALDISHNETKSFITLLHMLNKNEEGKYRFLPYELTDMIDLYGFTYPSLRLLLPLTTFEVGVSDGCLSKISTNSSPWNCDHLIRHSVKDTCYDIIKDIEKPIDQFLMVAMQLQDALFKIYSGQPLAFSQYICTVDETFYSPLPTRQYTLVNCCAIFKTHTTFYETSSAGFWNCHDPYLGTQILTSLAKFFAFVITILFMLTVKWLPKSRTTNEDDVDEETAGEKDLRLRPKNRFIRNCGHLALEMIPRQEEKDKTSNVLKRTNQEKFKWIILDDDAGYHFSLSVIVGYLLCFKRDNIVLIMARRLLLLYIFPALHLLASLQMNQYYPQLFKGSWQFHYTTYFMTKVIDPSEMMRDKWRFDLLLCFSLLIIPFGVAFTQFLLLSPILIQRRAISAILYWKEKETAVGKAAGNKVQKSHQDLQSSPSETRLYLNMLARLTYLANFKFWKYLFTERFFKVRWDGRNICRSTFMIILKLLLIPIAFPFYTFPIFTAFRVIFIGKGIQEHIGINKGKLILMKISIMMGLFYFFLILLGCITLYTYMIVFMLIDIIRTLSETFTQIMFLISVIVNIKTTFNSIEDRYRELKLIVFDIVEDMDTSLKDGTSLVEPLLKRFEHGTVAIPRQLFSYICKKYIPYSKLFTKAILFLLIKLAFLGILYVVIIDYQVLKQFSETGESIITIFFVSLPSLLSKTKSDAEMQLESRYLTTSVRGTITKFLKSGHLHTKGETNRRMSV